MKYRPTNSFSKVKKCKHLIIQASIPKGTLLLKGQTLADELAAIEDLEARITALLDEPKAKPE